MNDIVQNILNTPLHRGDESVDIVVFERNGFQVFLLATTAPEDIELLSAGGLDWSPVTDIPFSDVTNTIMFMNAVCKGIHMRCKWFGNSEMTEENIEPLHPSALRWPGNTPYQANLIMGTKRDLSNRRRAERDGVVVTLERPPNMRQYTTPQITTLEEYVQHLKTRPVACAMWQRPNDHQRVVIPSIYSSKNVGITIYYTNEFSENGGPLLHNKSLRLDGVISKSEDPSSTENLLVFGQKNTIDSVHITYADNSCSKMTHGLSLDISVSKDRFSGRNMLMVNGTRAIDETSQRLVLFDCVEYFPMPLVCGCVLTNRVTFERAHVPFVMAPSIGMVYVFRDSDTRGLIDLYVDEKLMMKIDPTKRKMLGDVWWITDSE